MTEGQSSEEKRTFSNAVSRVNGLYAGDKIDFIAGGSNPGERDSLWSSAAEEYPQHAAQILSLREALKRADKFKKRSHRELPSVFTVPFIDVLPDTTQLLAAILISRSLLGVRGHPENVREEFDLMAGELELPPGHREELPHPFRSKEAGELKLTDVIAKVLERKLRVLPEQSRPTPQTVGE